MVTRHTRAIEQYYRPITLNERYKITLLPSKTMIKVKELLCSIFSKQYETKRSWEYDCNFVIFNIKRLHQEVEFFTHETRIRKSPLREYHSFNPKKYCRLRHVILFQNGVTIHPVLAVSRPQGAPHGVRISLNCCLGLIKRFLCWKRNALNNY